MRSTSRNIVIIVPLWNEAENVPRLQERLGSMTALVDDAKFNILYVDDGSNDATRDIIASTPITVPVSYLRLSRNYGKEIAMIAGLDYAKDADGVVIIDADLQDPPELIPEMISWWEKGYDDVYARRRSRAGESWLKKITSKWFYKILQNSTRIDIQRDTGDFRLLDRRCVEAITQMRESQRYTKGMFSWIGYKKKELLYDRAPRAGGVTKWNYLRLIDLAIEGLTSFTTFPLRVASLLGIAISTISFAYMLVIVTKTIFYGSDIAGYPSIMAVVLFLGGVQLLSLGVIGEYVGRIFNETKNRPLYFIDEYHHGGDDDK